MDAVAHLPKLSQITVEIPEITLINVITWVCAGAMIFGGVVPFIPQYRDIKKSMNADGFSTFVCLTLLIANTLRILFWFGKHFELPLLAQSIIMIVTMMAMVELCVRVKQKTDLVATKQHTLSEEKRSRSDVKLHSPSPSLRLQHQAKHFFDFDTRYFWKWTDFLSYVEFMCVFAAVAGLLTYWLLDLAVYVEFIGFMAVFAEAMLGAPQFYRNFQNKSTIGMSIKMVCMWTMGDVFKTCYFIVREAPAQFWICGALQVSIDIGILCQVYYYKKYPQPPAKPAIQ